MADEMKVVQFDVDYIYETAGRNKGPVFKAWECYELTAEIAQRMVNHGLAHFVDRSKAKVQPDPIKAYADKTAAAVPTPVPAPHSKP